MALSVLAGLLGAPSAARAEFPRWFSRRQPATAVAAHGDAAPLAPPRPSTTARPRRTPTASRSRSRRREHQYVGDVRVLRISMRQYHDVAWHILDAQEAGHPRILTIDRHPERLRMRRGHALREYGTRPHLDRDEYPPAEFAEGGPGASVRYMNARGNRSAGASIGNLTRDLPDGAHVMFLVVP